MKVAVTGISGYLGRVLMPFLEQDPEIESITGIDVTEPPQSPKVKFVKRDVRDPAVKNDLEGCDALIHMAFIVMPLRSEAEMDSINIDGTKNIFQAAAEAGVKNVVYTSSVASYGAWPDNPVPVKEDWKIRPMPGFYYSRAKGAIEKWLDTFERERPEMRIVRLRPCIFVGPKINNLMREISSRKKMTSFKGLKNAMQLVWDEDVVQAILLALKKDVRGAFNLAGGGEITTEDMAEILGKDVVKVSYGFALALTKLLWKLGILKKAHPGWLEVTRYSIIMDCTKAEKELGWKPTYDTKETFRKFIESLET